LSRKFIIIFIALLFYVGLIAYSDFYEFSINISQFRFEFLPVILGVAFLAILVKGIRQQYLLKNIGVSIPWRKNILLYLAGLSMIVTPVGAGELIKSYFLKKKFGYNVAKTFPLVFVERMHDLIAIISLIVFTLVFIQNHTVLIVVSIVIAILVILYTALRIKKFFKIITKFLEKIPRLNKQIESISESYDQFHKMTSGKIMIKNWFLSIVAWSLDAAVVYMVFVGFNLNLEIIFTTFAIYSSLLIGIITLLPAGLGVTEITAVDLLTNKGISLPLATSIIIMYRLVGIWYATIIGFITTKIFLSSNPDYY